MSSGALKRLVIAVAILLAPAAVMAQRSKSLPVVGVLSFISPTTAQGVEGQTAFEEGLREQGLSPGEAVRIEFRHPDGKLENLDALARELVGLRVDVIVARGTPAIAAARRATTTIPIVMSATGGDPVAQGFVKSLGRPGGNVTGLTLGNQETLPKQLDLLKEIVPRAARVAVLGTGNSVVVPKSDQDLAAAASALGIKLEFVNVPSIDRLDGVLAEIRRSGVDGLLVRADLLLESNRALVTALVRKHRLPAVYWLRAYAESGGLVSYGTDLLGVHRRSAWYVVRILRGAKAADLPVEQPSRHALVVNLRIAKEIGVTIPSAILTRADEVLQ